MRILLGLGNPGARYARHRHNIGFVCADRLASRLRIRLAPVGDLLRQGVGQAAGEPVVVAMPETFMNLSGRAARALLDRHAGGVRDVGSLIVIHDEVDLPLGAVRIKVGGGHGGHNGLRSILEALGDPGCLRVRLGVGRPADPDADLAAWVLANFPAEQAAAVADLAERGADAVEILLHRGPVEAMHRVNAA